MYSNINTFCIDCIFEMQNSLTCTHKHSYREKLTNPLQLELLQNSLANAC